MFIRIVLASGLQSADFLTLSAFISFGSKIFTTSADVN